MALRLPEQFYAEHSKVFVKAPANAQTISGWRLIAAGKVKAALLSQNDNSVRLSCAYDAVFNLALAVVSAKGWRCTSAEGHHAQALEAACAYAGVSEAVFDAMDAVRDLRNGQYNGQPPSDDDVKYAIASMNRLIPEFMEILQTFK